jgi:hypothetical protein
LTSADEKRTPSKVSAADSRAIDQESRRIIREELLTNILVEAGAELVLAALVNAPVALACFVAAVLIVAVGGSLVMFLIKAGTLNILVVAERQALENPRAAGSSWYAIRVAHAYDIASLLEGIRRFGRRAMLLSLWLSLAYGVLAFAYFEALGAASRLSAQPRLGSIWPLIVVFATSAGFVAVTGVNLVNDLARIIVISDDCTLRAALKRLWLFLIEDSRQVIGILAVVSALFLLATAASVLVAAGLTLVAWVPVVGLVVVPLQAAAWLVRGLVFQFMGLSALAAYESQYRRFAQDAAFRIDDRVRVAN